MGIMPVMLIRVDGGVGPLNKAPCVTGEDMKTGVSGRVRQRPADGSLAVTGTRDLHTPFERFANHSRKLVSFHCIKFFVTGGY